MGNDSMKNDLSLTDPINSEKLLHDVRSLVERSRLRLAQSVNSELVLLCWRIGRCIREEIITEDRAAMVREW